MGPVRLQKTLFFADKENEAGWRLFTFKKYYLGQFSDELTESLERSSGDGENQVALWDGPLERLTANVPVLARGAFAHQAFFLRILSDVACRLARGPSGRLRTLATMPFSPRRMKTRRTRPASTGR